IHRPDRRRDVAAAFATRAGTTLQDVALSPALLSRPGGLAIHVLDRQAALHPSGVGNAAGRHRGVLLVGKRGRRLAVRQQRKVNPRRHVSASRGESTPIPMTKIATRMCLAVTMPMIPGIGPKVI